MDRTTNECITIEYKKVYQIVTGKISLDSIMVRFILRIVNYCVAFVRLSHNGIQVDRTVEGRDISVTKYRESMLHYIIVSIELV